MNIQQEKAIKLAKFQEELKNVFVYKYDLEDENKYNGRVHVNIDPEESFKADKAIYCVPPETTNIIPPEAQDGKIVLFNKEKNEWEVIEDCKGKKYYDIDKKEIIEVKTHRDEDGHLYLTEEDEKEIYSGKSVKIVKNKYEFYYTDEQIEDQIILEANSYLLKTDFYFYQDYPSEKIPEKMDEYREYLRTINSKKNLKYKDIREIKVLTYEEFIK